MKGFLRSFLRPRNLTLDQWGELLEAGFNGRPSATGQNVSEGTSMRISTVWSCQRLLAETVAGLPLETFRRIPGGGQEQDPDHPVAELLRSPNPDMTTCQLMEFAMVRLLNRGNGYFRILRLRNGRAGELWPITGHVDVTRPDPLGPLVYRVYSASKPEGEDSSSELVAPDDIWHVPGLAFNGITGMNPVEKAREMFGLAQATEEHGARLFSNGATVAGVLEHPGPLKKEARERLRADWHEVYGGTRNANRTAILESGLSYKSIGMSNEDAQFLETRQFQGEEIARFYRVPGHMVGFRENQPRANMEQLGREFVNFSLMPWLTRIVQSLERQVYLERDRRTHFSEFNVRQLLQADFATRQKGFATMRNWGALSPNEWRDRERLNPIPDGDEYVRPVNMTEVGSGESSAQNPGSQEGIRQSVTSRERALVQDAARRVTRREVGHLRKLFRDGSSPELVVKAETWFGKHAAFVREALVLEEDRAREYVGLRSLAIRTAVETGRMDALLAHFEEDDGATLAREVIGEA